MRLVVGASADHREDLAAARIDRDERGLREPRLAPGEDGIDARESLAHGVLRDALHVEIERRVDIDRAGRFRAFLEFLREVVDEMRRFGFERARNDQDRFV